VHEEGDEHPNLEPIVNASNLIRRADQIYEDHLKTELERTHPDYFVAIEPDSGDHFLGRTLSEASAAARAVHADKRTAVLRIGHLVTVHLGAGAT
jgi:hypothetical protein